MADRTENDKRHMRRALELAAQGLGKVEPNPMVGAVVVRDDWIVGEGFHEFFGGPHAEPNAISAAGKTSHGATLYVTLEPCTGTNKKTPPCCDAIIAAGISRVVIGVRDTTQQPAIPRLRAAGIEITAGVLEEDCRALIAPFLKLKQQGRPFVIAKWAMTADGKIATAAGDSKWISSEESRTLTHQWRGQVQAILVGAETARKDNPLLTCRVPGGRQPLRIVLDSNATLSPDSQLVRSITDAPLMVACHQSAPAANRKHLVDAGCRVVALPGENNRPDPEALLDILGKEEITYLLVEGGSETLTTFFDKQLIDEIRAFIAPKLAGGHNAPGPIHGAGIAAMSDALALTRVQWTPIGPDILLRGRIAHN